MSPVASAPDIERVRFSDKLSRLNELPDDLAAVALEVARELDEGAPMQVVSQL